MAEEDIIFGKNRHFFGGIEPSDMLTFNASSMYNVEKNIFSIKLECRLPKDTIIDNQKICTVDGAVIRRRTDRYPTNEFDGILIADIKEDQNITDTNVEEGVTYYYAAFPYSRLGVYNRSKENKTNATTVKRQYLFGYDIKLSDPNPETRVNYPSGVDNTNYTPARMDFETGSSNKYHFNYGDWPSNAGEKFMPRPCTINRETGLVYKYIKEDTSVGHYADQFVYYEDGTHAGLKTSVGYDVLHMMEWPKIYTKREEINGVYKFRCSDVPEDETWNCWCNYDDNGNIIEHFYISMGAAKTTSFSSISGSKTVFFSYFDYNKGDANNVESFYEIAKNTGPGWSPFRLVDHLLIQDLLVMMAKTTDLQSAYGYGPSSTSSSSNSPYAKMFYGYPSEEDRKNNVVFGLVNYLTNYGNTEFIDGWLMIRNGDTIIQKIKITGSTIDGSSCIGFNTTGDGYIEVEGATIPYSSKEKKAYISKMKTTPWGRIPYETEGSSTTYECDAMYMPSNMTDGNVYIAHKKPNPPNNGSYTGNESTGAVNGGFSVGFSKNDTSMAGRLSYKPPKKES